VLYCAEQLTEFLESCERNRRKDHDGPGREGPRHQARRKDNQVSSSRKQVSTRERANSDSATQPAKADQGSLPFSASR
jgi:hypothetical protein